VSVTVDEIHVPGPAEAWGSIGFTVDGDGTIHVGTVRIRPGAQGAAGWSLREAPSVTDVDGVPTEASDAPPGVPVDHPNGVTVIDHVVFMTPDVDRTIGAVQELGLDVRRERTPGALRQVFFRLGEVVLEVVGPAEPGEGAASLWGITFTVADVDAIAAALGDRLGRVKDAVQPGRRIATLRGAEPGPGVAIAFMSPRPATGTMEA
jgi:hypothetical protein